MKGTLTKNLFRRPQATNKVDGHGFLDKGSVIEIVESLTGVSVDGNATWHKASDGFFYWGGGVLVEGAAMISSISAHEPQIKFDSAKMSWAHDSLKIINIWKEGNISGAKTRVVILDRGFDSNHNDLNQMEFKSFYSDSGSIEHGTKMSGIIGANGKIVFGIAPTCEMFFAKVNFNNTESIVNALKWAREINADIVSMSFSCEYDERIEGELKQCYEQKIALIGAVGNAGQLGIPINKYPSSSPYCYAIGCFGKNFKRMDVSNLTSNLKLLAPAQSILTAMPSNNAAEVDGDTSLATAFTSGITALLLSVTRKAGKDLSGREIIESLCNNADKRNNEGENHNNKYGFGLIDPYKTYLTLK